MALAVSCQVVRLKQILRQESEKLKSNKSPGIDQIPAELIKAGGRTIHGEIHKLIISIWNKEEFPEEWKE
jgi:hypothetical protein